MGATVILAILTVEVEDLLYSVLCLGGMAISIAGLFWLLGAPFVAVFQLIVYAGAVVVLFIAAIMLTARRRAA
ncbi:MAG: NADH-quinone oxidoreductase subunit J [Candidatus Bathyarchaeia archaeon]